MTDTITTVLFEAGSSAGVTPTFMRMIVFAQSDHGKYVHDILEATYTGLESELKWITKHAASYAEHNSAAIDLKYLVRARRPNLAADYENVNIDDIDTGRCSKIESKLTRAIQMTRMV